MQSRSRNLEGPNGTPKSPPGGISRAEGRREARDRTGESGRASRPSVMNLWHSMHIFTGNAPIYATIYRSGQLFNEADRLSSPTQAPVSAALAPRLSQAASTAPPSQAISKSRLDHLDFGNGIA